MENTHIITRLREVRVGAETRRDIYIYMYKRQPFQENDSYIPFTCTTLTGNDR